jgi:hypothetical protein
VAFLAEPLKVVEIVRPAVNDLDDVVNLQTLRFFAGMPPPSADVTVSEVQLGFHPFRWTPLADGPVLGPPHGPLRGPNSFQPLRFTSSLFGGPLVLVEVEKQVVSPGPGSRPEPMNHPCASKVVRGVPELGGHALRFLGVTGSS